MSEAVLVRREGRVLVLVNNNPAARNAIAPGFYEGLAAGPPLWLRGESACPSGRHPPLTGFLLRGSNAQGAGG